MIYTTLNKIRDYSPCESGWVKLLKHLNKTHADDELLGFDVILESNNLDDALWCLRTLDEGNTISRRFALWCARQVEHLNTDPCIKNCNDVTERFISGNATQEEQTAAWTAAWTAARSAASDTRSAASDTRSAARFAADAAVDAAEVAARTARTAWAAARTATWAAKASAVDAQKTEFLRLLETLTVI